MPAGNPYISQSGGALASFRGPIYQRGSGLGSVFKSLFRFITPIFKPAARALGGEALGLGQRVLGDIVSGKNVKESLKRNARLAGSNLLHKAGEHFGASQTGTGRRRRTRKRQTTRRKKRAKRPKTDFLSF